MSSYRRFHRTAAAGEFGQTLASSCITASGLWQSPSSNLVGVLGNSLSGLSSANHYTRWPTPDAGSLVIPAPKHCRLAADIPHFVATVARAATRLLLPVAAA
jgi:hypothetical protein